MKPERPYLRLAGFTAAAAIGAGLITASGVDVESVYDCDGVVPEVNVQQADLSDCDLTREIEVEYYALVSGFAVVASSILSMVSVLAAAGVRREHSE